MRYSLHQNCGSLQLLLPLLIPAAAWKVGHEGPPLALTCHRQPAVAPAGTCVERLLGDGVGRLARGVAEHCRATQRRWWGAISAQCEARARPKKPIHMPSRAGHAGSEERKHPHPR